MSKQRIHKEGYKEFKLDKLENKLFKARKRIDAVQFERFSLEEQCAKDLKKGKTFLVNDPEYLKNNKRTVGGIFSPLFGADAISKDNNSIYSCNCQNLTGAFNLNKVCPVCGHKVHYYETDLSVVAYIDIAPYRIMTNTGLIEFKRNFKIKTDKDVIKRIPKITLKGHTEKVAGEPTIIDLYENYDDMYAEKIGIPKEHLFTSKIPIFNAALRPLIINGINITHFPINKDYMSLVTLQNDLVDVVRSRGTEVQVLKILNKIQELWFKIETEIEAQFNGKTGRFRKEMVAARINYVSRMVITLGDDLKIDEIILPYTTFLIEYEEEIVREVMNILDCSMKEALSQFYRAQNKVTKVIRRAILNILNRGDGCYAFINRNPTIAFGSWLLMRVKSVNFDLSDKTMYLPPDILPLMNADFDGDQLTQIALKFQELINAYEPFFSPINMIINRSDGYFNPSLAHKKDFAAILSAMSEISRKINAWNDSGKMDDKIREDLKRFGFDFTEENDLTEDERKDIVNEYLCVELNVES